MTSVCRFKNKRVDSHTIWLYLNAHPNRHGPQISAVACACKSKKEYEKWKAMPETVDAIKALGVSYTPADEREYRSQRYRGDSAPTTRTGILLRKVLITLAQKSPEWRMRFYQKYENSFIYSYNAKYPSVSEAKVMVMLLRFWGATLNTLVTLQSAPMDGQKPEVVWTAEASAEL